MQHLPLYGGREATTVHRQQQEPPNATPSATPNVAFWDARLQLEDVLMRKMMQRAAADLHRDMFADEDDLRVVVRRIREAQRE